MFGDLYIYIMYNKDWWYRIQLFTTNLSKFYLPTMFIIADLLCKAADLPMLIPPKCFKAKTQERFQLPKFYAIQYDTMLLGVHTCTKLLEYGDMWEVLCGHTASFLYVRWMWKKKYWSGYARLSLVSGTSGLGMTLCKTNMSDSDASWLWCSYSYCKILG